MSGMDGMNGMGGTQERGAGGGEEEVRVEIGCYIDQEDKKVLVVRTGLADVRFEFSSEKDAILADKAASMMGVAGPNVAAAREAGGGDEDVVARRRRGERRRGMSERDRIMGRLGKLKALAEGGVGGERENAARLLEEIAAKYGVDLDRLEESGVEREHRIEAKRGWRLELIVQLADVIRFEQYGDRKADHFHVFSMKNREGKVRYCFVKCTDAQWVELMAKYTVLARDYEMQLKQFLYAFLMANDLLAPGDGNGPPPTEKELEAARIARRMSLGIMKSALRKQIEGATA